MKNLRRLACKFDLNQSERKSSQGHASPGQTGSQVDPNSQLAALFGQGLNLGEIVARYPPLTRFVKILAMTFARF